jgi:hypothetical protein
VRTGGSIVVYGGKASVLSEQLETIALERHPGYDSGERHLLILRK